MEKVFLVARGNTFYRWIPVEFLEAKLAYNCGRISDKQWEAINA